MAPVLSEQRLGKALCTCHAQGPDFDRTPFYGASYGHTACATFTRRTIAAVIRSEPALVHCARLPTHPCPAPRHRFCDAAHTKGTFLSLRSLLTSVVPTFSSLLFDSVVMPLVLYLLVAAERRCAPALTSAGFLNQQDHCIPLPVLL